MKYKYTNKPIEEAAKAAAISIKEHLNNGENVLWLLSGGSSLEIATLASQQLQNINLSNLNVSLTDERYGKIGHDDENWQQLINHNLCLPGANLYRPLIGQNIKQTTKAFENWLGQQLKNTNYKIGIFGFGPDGHTAGIKPNSTAVSSQNLVTSFKGDDFERITITFNTIRQIDEAIIQASGENKQSVMHDIIDKDLSLEQQPAQILKEIKNATIYTNIKKENL